MSVPLISPMDPSEAAFSEKLIVPSGLIAPPVTNNGTGSAECALIAHTVE